MLMSLPARYWLKRRTMPGWSVPKAVMTKRSDVSPGVNPPVLSAGRTMTWNGELPEPELRTRSAKASGSTGCGTLTIMISVK